MVKATDTLRFPQSRDIEHDYQLWAKAHRQIKDGPAAKDGRDYVKHAKNLLPILEALSELHPIAKTVVGCFKAVVMYEQERKENDARVAVLFLAQSDMMSALLDVNQLSEKRRERLDGDRADLLPADRNLPDILFRVEKEIRECGNSMDTYYGEKRIIKFLKAPDWKERIADHMARFDEYRVLIQQTLSVQVASDVNSLVNKMDLLLLRLFMPKENWEKEVAAKTRLLTKEGESKHIINDAASLQALVDLTKDPSWDTKDIGDDAFREKQADFGVSFPSQFEQLKKDLNLSLDALCDRNKEIFELKLSFHTRQLQESIQNSAQYVVESLSGPYDRLHNEDLKTLWKEMNWIFCVDNNLFTSALFEYYLDHFSSSRNLIRDVLENEDNPDSPHHQDTGHLGTATFLSLVGVQNHVDAWALEPMVMYPGRISSTIDRDDSGFIRISEANAFTDRMPEGWTLPQWCAYAAIGWTYEARIYRKRINNILSKMFEMQANVLPVNRYFAAISTYPQIAPFFQLLAWEPWEPTVGGKSETSPLPDTELRYLVHDKMKKEDKVWRDKLRSLNWTIEDESTLQLLYGKEPLETYILQLSVLLLEYAYDVMQVGMKLTIDAKEISHLLAPLRLLKRLSISRVESLKAQFKKEGRRKRFISEFQGGIWDCVNMVTMEEDSDDEDEEGEEDSEEDSDDNNSDNDDAADSKSVEDQVEEEGDDANVNPPPLPFQTTDVDDFGYDEAVLEEFPLLPLADGCLPYLKYKPWEEYIKSAAKNDIPTEVPNTWHSENQEIIDEDDEDLGSRHDWADFPLTFRECNVCKKSPIKEFYYACTQCHDTDICAECYERPFEANLLPTHESWHSVMRFALHTASIHREWMAMDAQFQIEEMRDDLNAILQDQEIGDGDEVSETPGEDDGEVSEDSETDQVIEELDCISHAGSGGSWVDESDDQSDMGDEDVDTKSIQIKSPYTCRRCLENIPLDAETTFYKCFRHACREYWLCRACAHQKPDDDKADGHLWWHSLIVLRRDILLDLPEDANNDTENLEKSREVEEDAPKAESGFSDAIVTAIRHRISTVEAKIDATNLMLQDVLSSALEEKIQSRLTQIDSTSATAALESRISRLEDKVDTMVTELRSFMASFSPNK